MEGKKMKRILITFYCAVLLTGFKDVFSQWNYGQPFSTSAPSATWQQVVNPLPVSGNSMLDSLTKPYPTNAWFNMLFLYGTAYPYIGGQGSLAQNKVWVNPYLVGIGHDYSSFVNKTALLAVNYKPFNVNEIGGQYPTILWDNGSFFYLGTTSSASPNIKSVIKNNYTDLSFTLKFFDSANPGNYYEAPVVRGMPYVTMIYNNITPVVHTPLNAVAKINNTTANPGQTFNGTTFKLTTTGTSGAFRPQEWMIFSSSNITFTVMPGAMGLQGPDNFTGYIRVAHVTYDGDPNAADTTAKINLLNSYAKFIPVSGTFSSAVAASSNSADFHFNFTRYNEGSLGSDSLLMMALPHHMDMSPANQTSNILKYSVIKGTMSEIYGKTWNLTEQLPQYSWNPRYGNLSTVPHQWTDTIHKFVNDDFTALFNRNYMWTDIYSAGKSLARLGRVITIADELFDKDPSRYADMNPLAAKMRDSLQLFLGKWLDGKSSIVPNVSPVNRDSLLYDTRFGGIISSRSYDSISVGSGVDFGSALYNDHHFHYGYLIYAAAAIAKKNSSFFTSNNNYYLNRTLDLIRDYGNPSRSDSYFAMQRYKDVYDGNSWANGLVPYGNGKNQESSSEAVNAWYGMYLFGLAMGNENVMNTGRLFLAQEIRAAQKYYHISLPQTNPVYPAAYTNVFHNVVNLYSGEIDAHNFFLTVNYINAGIQAIPVIPPTEQLWKKTFATDIYNYTPNGLVHTPCFDPGNTSTVVWNWTTINAGIQAIADADAALSFFHNYGYNIFNYDNGASPSNLMYWILTRKYAPVIGIDPIGNHVAENFLLHQNFPNPFNPVTKIKFEVPAGSSSPGNVSISVFDELGRKLAVLFDQKASAGIYEVQWDASGFSSGVYFYKLSAPQVNVTKKMILIK